MARRRCRVPSSKTRENTNTKTNKNNILLAVAILVAAITVPLLVRSILSKESSEEIFEKDDGGVITEKTMTVFNDGTSDDFIILGVMPHDAKAFTQGFAFSNGKLYESTGLYGESQLRVIDPTDGTKVLQSISLQDKFFGEGLTHFQDKDGIEKLILLTWKENVGFIYDAETLVMEKEFRFETNTDEGWGITYDKRKKVFAVSDGSEYIHFWDRDTLKESHRVKVFTRRDNGMQTIVQPVRYLNELEYLNGRILANVWYQDVIVQIDPDTGFVIREYNLSDLWTERTRGADCLNGIALTDVKNELLVTGKLWPVTFRIQLQD